MPTTPSPRKVNLRREKRDLRRQSLRQQSPPPHTFTQALSSQLTSTSFTLSLPFPPWEPLKSNNKAQLPLKGEALWGTKSSRETPELDSSLQGGSAELEGSEVDPEAGPLACTGCTSAPWNPDPQTGHSGAQWVVITFNPMPVSVLKSQQPLIYYSIK